MVSSTVGKNNVGAWKWELTFWYRFKRTGKRDEIFLATKVGIYMQNNRTINGDPEYIKSQCAKSLQRLGVESVDLYYLHR